MHSVPGAFAFISRAFCCISGIVRRDRFSSHTLLRGMNELPMHAYIARYNMHTYAVLLFIATAARLWYRQLNLFANDLSGSIPRDSARCQACSEYTQ
jgi:hypothetical protein